MPFENIKNQDSAVRILKEGIASGRVFSSYLFTGPEGVGKKGAAFNFAKALNCTGGQEKPCEACVSCAKINSGNHPDVFCLQPTGASSTIGISEIREVIRNANLKPYEAEKKIFIIDGAERMNHQAQNAFLKTLEEPPGDNVFILVSRSRELLLSTIASRCQLVRFSAVPAGTIARLAVEKLKVSEAQARLAANFASGSVGRAFRMLDAKNGVIEKRNRLIKSFFDKGEAFPEVMKNYSGKEELKESADLIVSYLRDAFLYKKACGEGILFNGDRIGDIKKAAEKFSEEELVSITERLLTLRSYVDCNVNPRTIAGAMACEIEG